MVSGFSKRQFRMARIYAMVIVGFLVSGFLIVWQVDSIYLSRLTPERLEHLKSVAAIVSSILTPISLLFVLAMVGERQSDRDTLLLNEYACVWEEYLNGKGIPDLQENVDQIRAKYTLALVKIRVLVHKLCGGYYNKPGWSKNMVEEFNQMLTVIEEHARCVGDGRLEQCVSTLRPDLAKINEMA